MEYCIPGQPVHLMVKTQDMEYLVLDVSPGQVVSSVPTVSVEVYKLGSSIPTNCICPTFGIIWCEAEQAI